MNSNLLSMKRWVRGIFYIVLITVALIQIYPFFWVVTSSLKTDADLARQLICCRVKSLLGIIRKHYSRIC